MKFTVALFTTPKKVLVKAESFPKGILWINDLVYRCFRKYKKEEEGEGLNKTDSIFSKFLASDIT